MTKSLVVFLAILLFQCSEVEVSGVSTETTNGSSISGIVQSTQGVSPLAKVALVKKNFIPTEDTVLSEVTADAEGTYKLNNVPKGEYYILSQSQGEETFARTSIAVRSSNSNVGQNVYLEQPALIVMSLENREYQVGDRVYMNGSFVNKVIQEEDLERNSIVIQNIPPGQYESLVWKKENTSTRTNLLKHSLHVKENNELFVDPVRSSDGESSSGTNNDVDSYENTIRAVVHLPKTKREESVHHYPLLVRFDKSSMDSDLSPDNILIRREGHEFVPFDVEVWNNSEAQLWISIDSVTPTMDSLVFYMEWINSKTVFTQYTSVFDEAMKYKAVYHFNENPESFSGVYNSVPVTNRIAVTKNIESASYATEGIGRGLELLEDSTFVVVPTAFVNPQEYTVSLWFKTTTNTGGVLAQFNTRRDMGGVTHQHDRQIWMGDSGTLHYGTFPLDRKEGEYTVQLNTTHSYNDGNWHHVAVTLSPDYKELYIDGELYSDTVGNVASEITGYWGIGHGRMGSGAWFPKPTSDQFIGFMDEVRISHRRFSSTRIRLNYETQRP